ncbi:efflux RND transporter periplasmic adaptor subunit [Salinisphaera sp. LB1]|uniref:efflux RND transporter periplasmic adaptor subunit n=1 Tax=Salinisphaera sp. LB1 TaxID=2183911 RepID=UPI000D7D908F|nr:efflux RND transporter periplasmic adaptor subunit [Salinisphaera sp. LB1]AWN15962.1 putative Co/Zn/Cd efflux system membrane fusion protein [Salinisphaera sp. LB1]
MPDTAGRGPSLVKRMIVMVVGVLLLVALIVGAKVGLVMRKIASLPKPAPATVSTAVARYQAWQPALHAVGSLRAVRGADLALDVPGLVNRIHVRSGQHVNKGELLLQLNDADDRAQLAQLEAAARLSRLNYRRADQQRASHAISTADYDSAAADLKGKQAAVAGQKALVSKKQLRAPFAGRAGIITVSPGDYLNAGTAIVTLQQIDSLYADFSVPQRAIGRLQIGQTIHLAVDAYDSRRFDGRVTAINPKVDTDTRNVQVEAIVPNADGALLPGMFANIRVDAGRRQRYLTLPQAAIVYNPYGDMVFVVQPSKGNNEQGQPLPATVQQTLVTTGETRGDQVAIVKGLAAGATVVTSGQIKLSNGAPITIDNNVQPADAAHPTPQEH